MSADAPWTRVWRYFSHRNPRVALIGTVALIVVGNQPFYPFYVWYLTGTVVPAAFLTWLSTPLFAVSPALARDTPFSGRVTLLVAAIGNTVISAVGLGPASGVELFYGPCLLLAWVLFPPGRRRQPVLWVAASILAGCGIERLVGPLSLLDAAQSHRLAIMHAVSVVALTAIIALQAFRVARSEAALSRTAP